MGWVLEQPQLLQGWHGMLQAEPVVGKVPSCMPLRAAVREDQCLGITTQQPFRARVNRKCPLVLANNVILSLSLLLDLQSSKAIDYKMSLFGPLS